MKKIFLILFVSVILLPVSGQVAIDLDEELNFDLTLKDIVILVESGKSSEISMDKYLLLEGVVSAREVLYADEENYVGLLELSFGEWEGLEKVEMYQCYVQLQGLEFSSMIPARRSRTANPDEIALNTKVLVLCRYLGYNEDDSGKRYPVLDGFKVRKLD